MRFSWRLLSIACVCVMGITAIVLTHMGWQNVRAKRQRERTVANIHRAAESGDLARLGQLIESHPELVDSFDNYGETALHKAANGRTVELLIKAGASVDVNDHGWEPIHASRNLGVTQALAAAGASISARDNGGYAPLHCAKSVEIAEFLLSKGADLNARTTAGQTPLETAVLAWRWDVARFLAEAGAEIDIFSATALGRVGDMEVLLLKDPNIVHATDDRGGTPLHTAARYGRVEALEFLIKKGGRVNAQDENGKTALHLAAAQGRANAVRVLLENGAEPRIRTKEGQNAIDAAKNHRNWGIVELLQAMESDTDCRMEDMWGDVNPLSENL